MMITVWWKNWAWKWTLCKTLAESLWYDIVSIWNIKRGLATEMGLTILEFDKIWWENPEKAKEFDLKYEEYQQGFDVAQKIILDSRMSFWCQPKAFNIFLDVDEKEWARRVYEQQRADDATESLEAVLSDNAARHLWFKETYMKLYGVDIYDLSQYDLVVDTTDLTPVEVFQLISEWFEAYSSL